MTIFSFIKNKLKAPLLEREYSIHIYGRGEEMTYTDPDLKLDLERTYCSGHRLYCNNTQKDRQGNIISLKKRQAILDNLCDHFKTKESPNIFVLDIADKDHDGISTYIANLADKGHKVSIESDSAEIREQHQEDMYLGILKAGKKLSINGTDIGSVEEYFEWKKNA
jgi:hypothetical protein